ncbi:MAG TPA: DUF3224 domain-containing protein [Steroidobacteraceae bacterium]|nr:DUF3224 domain-containing protein [Steroidobacteraceae bacterium]
MKFAELSSVLIALLWVAESSIVFASDMSKEIAMNSASGNFEVKLTPLQPDNDPARKATLARMSLEKQFSGELSATSTGEMLACGDGTTSGAYVAIEKVTGSLAGRKGSFMLVHHGLMNRGTSQAWTVTVVPDSGTDELKGLTGTMKIVIEKGKHSYELAYRLE